MKRGWEDPFFDKDEQRLEKKKRAALVSEKYFAGKDASDKFVPALETFTKSIDPQGNISPPQYLQAFEDHLKELRNLILPVEGAYGYFKDGKLDESNTDKSIYWMEGHLYILRCARNNLCSMLCSEQEFIPLWRQRGHNAHLLSHLEIAMDAIMVALWHMEEDFSKAENAVESNKTDLEALRKELDYDGLESRMKEVKEAFGKIPQIAELMSCTCPEAQLIQQSSSVKAEEVTVQENAKEDPRVETMSITKKPFEYKDSTGKLYEGYLAYPSTLESSSSLLPGILVLHAFGGCGDFEKEKADDLAKRGYVALAADVYGKGIHGSSKEECFALLRPLIAGDRSELGERLTAARDALAGVKGVDTGKIGALGFCFGGLCALDMARRNEAGLKAAVSFHGTLKPIEGAPLTEMNASIQVHNGQADSHIGKDQISAFYDEMNERKADWCYTEHGHALHGFTEPLADKMGVPGVGYQKIAAERSWKMMLAFMEEKLA